MTFLANGACAVRKRIPVHMLLITPQMVNAFDVNVTYFQPHSRTTYANYVKYDAVSTFPTSIPNMT